MKAINDGRMVPLTLLPLKLGSLVAFRIKDFLEGCAAKSLSSDDHNGSKKSIPSVTVKWPNDVLLHYRSEQNDKQHQSHEKVAGILIESSQDWFLIGIGINVGYAPDIPTEGVDYGRKATCLSQYCNTALAGGTAEGDLSSKGEDSNAKDEEEYWIEISKQLAKDIALDMHSWLHPSPNSPTYTLSDGNLGESILIEWKSYIDWNMELILRDTEKRERVTLNGVLEDGRVVVKEKDTGATRTLVADYFL